MVGEARNSHVQRQLFKINFPYENQINSLSRRGRKGWGTETSHDSFLLKVRYRYYNQTAAMLSMHNVCLGFTSSLSFLASASSIASLRRSSASSSFNSSTSERLAIPNSFLKLDSKLLSEAFLRVLMLIQVFTEVIGILNCSMFSGSPHLPVRDATCKWGCS